jgi:hypothetical protein
MKKFGELLLAVFLAFCVFIFLVVVVVAGGYALWLELRP